MTNKIMYWHELTLTLTSLLIVNNCITICHSKARCGERACSTVHKTRVNVMMKFILYCSKSETKEQPLIIFGSSKDCHM